MYHVIMTAPAGSEYTDNLYYERTTASGFIRWTDKQTKAAALPEEVATRIATRIGGRAEVVAA